MDKLINEFFSARYDYILMCATNMLKLIKRQDLKYELVNDAFIYIQSNQDKLKTLLEAGKIEAVTVRWMDMQIKWNNTGFKKAWVYPNTKIVSYDNIIKGDVDSDFLNSFLIDESLSEEETLQQEKEIQDKLNHINAIVSNMTLDKQLLYNDIYNLQINSKRKLAKHTGISPTSCYYLMRNLKNEIKTTYKK